MRAKQDVASRVRQWGRALPMAALAVAIVTAGEAAQGCTTSARTVVVAPAVVSPLVVTGVPALPLTAPVVQLQAALVEQLQAAPVVQFQAAHCAPLVVQAAGAPVVVRQRVFRPAALVVRPLRAAARLLFR